MIIYGSRAPAHRDYYIWRQLEPARAGAGSRAISRAPARTMSSYIQLYRAPAPPALHHLLYICPIWHEAISSYIELYRAISSASSTCSASPTYIAVLRHIHCGRGTHIVLEEHIYSRDDDIWKSSDSSTCTVKALLRLY